MINPAIENTATIVCNTFVINLCLFIPNCSIFLVGYNVSSISGVHYGDEAKLCNKYHFTNRAD